MQIGSKLIFPQNPFLHLNKKKKKYMSKYFD